MFRWLTDQYPDILNRQIEQHQEEGGIASSDLQVSNFYLDMNGIIHPCTHGNANDEIIILDETAMFKKIFLYVDRYVRMEAKIDWGLLFMFTLFLSHSLTHLFIHTYKNRLYKLVRPSNVLYLAVDGVAPRAKMNQQRSRRFRSAKEAEATAAEIIARYNHRGKHDNYKNQKELPSELLSSNAKRFDSNCITPGTDFMLKLSLALQKWVAYKMETDPFWKNGADVIVSGPDVPGEGEHKVMDFLREQKENHLQNNNPNNSTTAKSYWHPNMTHVLYGLDADLIMLGLVTHEPQFLLLREKMSVVMSNRRKSSSSSKSPYRKPKDMLEYDANDFEILELSALRQMLALQFRKFADPGQLQVPYDLERIIDDFVFMCMLVGNDFLPHVPHLEIDSGALSLMMSNYIDLLPEWGGYLTKKERIHPQRFEQFMYHLSIYEEEHFHRRGYEENEPGWKLSSDDEQEQDDFYGTYYSGHPTPPCAVTANTKQGKSPDAEERAMAPTGNRAFRRKHPENLSRSYRDFYYSVKLGWQPQDRSRTLFRRREHVREYLEGLHWNLNYYHRGCPSWDWFFPYLYAPLATDMVNIAEFYHNADSEGFCSFEFEPGEPFPSLAQLLSVLPPQSADLLPKPLAELMYHPSSPLVPYYPADFQSDPNGKRQSWEAVVQIPFIEKDVLLDSVQRILDADESGKNLLTPAERRRNARGREHTFVAPGLTEEERKQLQDAPKKVVKGTMPVRKRPAPTKKKTVTKAIDRPSRKSS
jgi:5'-3' exonuclease